ncbi:MAG: hypothetical protein LBG86_00740 [Puniceicoccales bacterium]|nr:hypothetical protein [Puniceicoccales bacterium]
MITSKGVKENSDLTVAYGDDLQSPSDVTASGGKSHMGKIIGLLEGLSLGAISSTVVCICAPGALVWLTALLGIPFVAPAVIAVVIIAATILMGLIGISCGACVDIWKNSKATPAPGNADTQDQAKVSADDLLKKMRGLERDAKALPDQINRQVKNAKNTLLNDKTITDKKLNDAINEINDLKKKLEELLNIDSRVSQVIDLSEALLVLPTNKEINDLLADRLTKLKQKLEVKKLTEEAKKLKGNGENVNELRTMIEKLNTLAKELTEEAKKLTEEAEELTDSMGLEAMNLKDSNRLEVVMIDEKELNNLLTKQANRLTEEAEELTEEAKKLKQLADELTKKMENLETKSRIQ